MRQSATTRKDSFRDELDKYHEEISSGVGVENPLWFWQTRATSYPRLAPVAEDYVCAPAFEACVERIFSVAGLLSSGQKKDY